MEEQKLVLFVRNNQVLEDVLKQVDKNLVVSVFNFESFENFPSNIIPEGFNISGLEQFKGGGYKGIIAIGIGKPKDESALGRSFFHRLSLAAAGILKRNEIPFSFWAPATPYIHVYGKFPDIKVDPCSDNFRNPKTLGLIQEVFQNFHREFEGKELDLWMSCSDDWPLGALRLAKALDIPHVFCYSTTYAMRDRVTAFPDYESCYNESKFYNPFNTHSKCIEAAEKPYEDNRAFWRGNLFTSFTRYCLFELGKKYPDYLKIEDSSEGQWVHMPDQAKYKYLIDTRGNGWSSRLQTLLKLGRPIFMVDRPFREWYFDRMIAWKHYVPVKEDLSDLIKRYKYMESHPDVYDEMVKNLREFVDENLTPSRIVFDMKELMLRYAVVK